MNSALLRGERRLRRETALHVAAHARRLAVGQRDIRPPDDSVDAIDLRLYLRINGRPLTETWIYQWTPPSIKERKAAIS